LIYLERIPAAPLAGFVRALWYSHAPDLPLGRERMLPGGCVQVILNLARDFLLDCPEGTPALRRPASLLVGARSVYEIVDNSDMAELVGVVFEPGGFAQFVREPVDRFSNLTVGLEDVWGSSVHTLRDRLRELPDPESKMQLVEAFLLQQSAANLSRNALARNPLVQFAVSRFGIAPGMTTVRDVAQAAGLSERRFSQLFRERVGLSPKVWCRVQRFQRAVHQLHAGRDLPWAALALDCGFYDQAHFANEFRAFSGIDATTYSARRTQWANHVPAGEA
jgi:AraC-like DNA-binding protein